MINEEVSNASVNPDYKSQLDAYIQMGKRYSFTNPYLPESFYQKKKLPKGKPVDVRIEPKIGRNDICPKCDSGLKYKKCCGLN